MMLVKKGGKKRRGKNPSKHSSCVRQSQSGNVYDGSWMILHSGSGKEEQMFPRLLVRGFCGVPVKSGEVYVGSRYLKLSLAGWKYSAYA